MRFQTLPACVLLTLCCAIAAWATDASGKWTTTISTQIGELAYTYEFKTFRFTESVALQLRAEAFNFAHTPVGFREAFLCLVGRQ